MTLHKLNQLVSDHPEKEIQLRLPSGALAPPGFHITEVAHVRKDLVDCGGRVHAEEACQLQAWGGTDDKHRIAGAKLGKILAKAARLFVRNDVSVEVEYGSDLVSQYPGEGWKIEGNRLVLKLSPKHTDCRARDVCSSASMSTPCCGGLGVCAA
ncbi:MAG: DUF6428 family protein [Verrucomicrobiales bacterium]